MSIAALALTLVFVLVALLLSLWQKFGMEKDILIATVRSSVQLIVVGYLLKFVFSLQSPLYILLMILIMILVAAHNVKKKTAKRWTLFLKIVAALTVTECITQGFLLVTGIVPEKAQYIIPISGMIIGNSMVVSSLLLNRMRADVKARTQEILVVLCLGGTAKQAIFPILKQSIRASMIPTIDSTKTIGLVQLPGMMTGQIIAGADPIQAVRYQILIVFTLMASAAMTSFVLGFLAYTNFFNQYQQVVME
ncbi:iron export ABC transporter permease subunit FetB [Fodinisporobacter ferrooxydans]|uniref:Iron export ABC transporter permease subunit FetB n=1 Tax=Fodinisporobacter ferrooxydans TaxID=2901836 RepID=A0ABY4CNM5_9BACL|nr:iron export ABC transporter permease subunit FetB [Alicyclobacillaceae bacterium MYW30-H2]